MSGELNTNTWIIPKSKEPLQKDTLGLPGSCGVKQQLEVGRGGGKGGSGKAI